MPVDESLVQAVWEKGRGMPERDTNEWRKDQCGAWLHREQYNNGNSDYGWKIENVTPGGEDILENLQPLHFKNTFDIANGQPHCRVTADRTDLAPGQHIDQPRNTGV
jgi:hypothetical protein